MNTFASKTVFAIVALFCVFSLFANTAISKRIENVSVKVVPVTTIPDVRNSSHLSVSMQRNRIVNHWMAIVVEYTPKFDNKAKTGRSKSKSRNAAAEDDTIALYQHYLDNVEVKVRAICETVGPQGRPQYALFNGSSKLWYIKLDGQRHVLTFFLPPWMIDRYYFAHNRVKLNQMARSRKSTSLDAGQRINKSDLKVEVSFNVNNSTVAVAYANVSGNKKTPARVNFGKMLEKVAASYNFEGAILSRGQSPWANSDINLFDPEKPAGAK